MSMGTKRPTPNCGSNNSGVTITRINNDYQLSLCFNGSCITGKWMKCNQNRRVCESLPGQDRDSKTYTEQLTNIK